MRSSTTSLDTASALASCLDVSGTSDAVDAIVAAEALEGASR